MKKSFLLILVLALCSLAACTSDPGTESSSAVTESISEAESEITSESSSASDESSVAVTEYYDEYGRFVELDEQGHIKKVTDYKDDGSVFLVKDYEDGVLVKSTWYDGERVSIVIEFVEDERPIKRTEYALDGKIHSIDEYDDRGVITKETIFYDDGKDWILFEFKDGRQAKETTYRENGDIDSVLEFDKNEFPIKYIEYIDGVIDSYEEYENDENGFAIRTNCYDPNGTLTAYVESEYDGDGNLVMEATYTPEGNLIHIFTLLYDANGQIVSQSNYLYTENGMFYQGTRLHLDRDGNWASETIAEKDAYDFYDSIVSSQGN